MKRKKKGVFSDFKESAVGISSIGLSTAVGTGIASKGGVNMGSSYLTLSRFTPLVVTAKSGKSVFKTVKKLKK